MRRPGSRSTLAAALFLFSFMPATAHAIERYMQLVGPGQGWAVGEGGLFWTQDDGAHWKNISPPGVHYFNDVFFLDPSHGWVLYAGDGQKENTLDFHVAATSDGGATWTNSLAKTRAQAPDQFNGTAWLDFVDVQHGWLLLRQATGVAFSIGWLLATDDGGKTWKQLPDPPIASRPSFATATTGWLAGGAGGDELYATHDGGKSWQGQDVAVPASTGGANRPAYGRPEFKDTRRGFIPVVFSPENYSSGSQTSTLVLFSTHNGGQSWKPDRALPNLHDDGVVLPSVFAVPDSVLILAPSFDRRHLTLLTVAGDGKENRVTTEVAEADATVRELSFASPSRGWILTNNYRLLATADGGTTWKWLVPGAAPRDLPPPPPPAHPTPLKKLGEGPALPPPGRPPQLRDEPPADAAPSSPSLYVPAVLPPTATMWLSNTVWFHRSKVPKL